MQGGHGYGGYGYGYDAGAAYGSGGGYGYDAGAAYGSAGGYYSNDGYPSAPAYEDPLAAGRSAHGFPAPPLNGLELQPSETCPRNYVIFDQTRTDSRVTFHPSLAQRLGGSSSGHDSSCHGAGAGKGACRDNDDDDSCRSVRQEEDAEEIDALLSSEDGSSPDSTCSSSGKPHKKERLKKMMRTLKGIVPGGDRMDTPAVLDEAVRYLKSLKVDAKKLGVRGSSS